MTEITIEARDVRSLFFSLSSPGYDDDFCPCQHPQQQHEKVDTSPDE